MKYVTVLQTHIKKIGTWAGKKIKLTFTLDIPDKRDVDNQLQSTQDKEQNEERLGRGHDCQHT